MIYMLTFNSKHSPCKVTLGLGKLESLQYHNVLLTRSPTAVTQLNCHVHHKIIDHDQIIYHIPTKHR